MHHPLEPMLKYSIAAKPKKHNTISLPDRRPGAIDSISDSLIVANEQLESEGAVSRTRRRRSR
jgi:hypothetical protein